MNRFPVFFAEAASTPWANRWMELSASTRELIAILAAVGLLVCLLLVWAIFGRQRQRERSRLSDQDWTREKNSGDDAGSGGKESRRRRRRRRREHRPRNPTLAETRGLPPLRPEDPSEPTA